VSRESGSDAKHDLPDVGVAAHALLRDRGRGEREHAVDHRAQAAVGERGEQVLREAANHLGVLLERAGAEGDADQAQALAGQEVEVQLGDRAPHSADADQPAAQGERSSRRSRPMLRWRARRHRREFLRAEKGRSHS